MLLALPDPRIFELAKCLRILPNGSQVIVFPLDDLILSPFHNTIALPYTLLKVWPVDQFALQDCKI